MITIYRCRSILTEQSIWEQPHKSQSSISLLLGGYRSPLNTVNTDEKRISRTRTQTHQQASDIPID